VHFLDMEPGAVLLVFTVNRQLCRVSIRACGVFFAHVSRVPCQMTQAKSRHGWAGNPPTLVLAIGKSVASLGRRNEQFTMPVKLPVPAT
jgi:hypothetical protein